MPTSDTPFQLARRSLQSGDLDRAAELYRQAIAIDPRHFAAHASLGSILLVQQRLSAALVALQTAAELDGGVWQVHFDLGHCLSRQKRLPAAVEAYRRALALNPNSAEVHHALGLALSAQKQFSAAADSQRAALALQPNHFSAQQALAAALEHLGQCNDAKHGYLRALEMQPGDFSCRLKLAALMVRASELSDQDVQVDAFHDATAQDARTLRLRGITHAWRGEWSLAREVFARAFQTETDNAVAHYCRGMSRLALGDFAGGWPEYEWLLKTGPAIFEQPAWDGANLHGQDILIHTENMGRLGDVLQFVRYVRLVEERSGHVLLQAPRALFPLLAESGFRNLVTIEEALSLSCPQVSLLSLPRIFGTTLATILAELPYLAASPDLVEHWRSELASHAPFKIGITWCGEPTWYLHDRSIPLSAFELLARVPGVALFSLQKQTGLDELASIRESSATTPFPIVDFGDQLDEPHGPFMDTAAIMKNLDLVITCDTATAHLAGALGVPVWTALTHNAEWRWLIDRTDSPWYPTMKLLRQHEPGNWREVFERMAKLLAEERQ